VRLKARDDELYAEMQKYGIDPKHPSCWHHLCIVLFDKQKTVQLKQGAPAKWNSRTKSDLVGAINRIRYRSKARKTVQHAASILKSEDRLGRWKKYSAATLAARYSEFEDELTTKRIVKKILHRLDTKKGR
jgi:hypothetical protein